MKLVRLIIVFTTVSFMSLQSYGSLGECANDLGKCADDLSGCANSLDACASDSLAVIAKWKDTIKDLGKCADDLKEAEAKIKVLEAKPKAEIVSIKKPKINLEEAI